MPPEADPIEPWLRQHLAGLGYQMQWLGREVDGTLSFGALSASAGPSAVPDPGATTPRRADAQLLRGHPSSARRRVWYPFQAAMAAAEALMSELWPGCERIEVAGSLRRGLPEVHDVELLASPAYERDLFGQLGRQCGLSQQLDRLLARGRLLWRQRGRGLRQGQRYYALLDSRSRIPVDLFVVRPPAQWGALMALRTGPRQYSQRLVMSCRHNGLRCVGGRLEQIATGETLQTPEEEDFVRACGLPYVPPAERR